MEGISIDDEALCAFGRSVIQTEAAALVRIGERLDASFAAACRLLLGCQGRIVVCGIGKSGHIGTKIAATFASTGSPAFFVHAAEASHGDLGMVQPGDVVLAISYSGSSNEVLTLVPGIKRLGIPLISLCGEPESALALASDVQIDTSVTREACPLNLAPTASTTVSLAMGDALAIALLGARGFDENDFARSHPGGRLGRRLLLRVSDVMISGDAMPIVRSEARLSEALFVMTKKGLGMVLVADANDRLAGVFTDGDLRRTLEGDGDVRQLQMETIMTREPQSVEPDELAFDAVNTMQSHRITFLPVIAEQRLLGVVTMHAMLVAGVI